MQKCASIAKTSVKVFAYFCFMLATTFGEIKLMNNWSGLQFDLC